MKRSDMRGYSWVFASKVWGAIGGLVDGVLWHGWSVPETVDRTGNVDRPTPARDGGGAANRERPGSPGGLGLETSPHRHRAVRPLPTAKVGLERSDGQPPERAARGTPASRDAGREGTCDVASACPPHQEATPPVRTMSDGRCPGPGRPSPLRIICA